MAYHQPVMFFFDRSIIVAGAEPRLPLPLPWSGKPRGGCCLGSVSTGNKTRLDMTGYCILRLRIIEKMGMGRDRRLSDTVLSLRLRIS
jgi:hypothetical protein